MNWTSSEQPLRSHSWTQTNRDLYYVREAERTTQTEESFYNSVDDMHNRAQRCLMCGAYQTQQFKCFVKRCTLTVCPSCMCVYGGRILCINCRRDAYDLFDDHLPDFSDPHWYEGLHVRREI